MSNADYHKAYYRANKQAQIDRVREWKLNDPTGEKAKKLKIWKLKSQYRKYHTPKRAISLYIAVHNCQVEDIDIPMKQLISEMDKLIEKVSRTKPEATTDVGTKDTESKYLDPLNVGQASS